MNQQVMPFDVIEIGEDLPEFGIVEGQVGSILDVHPDLCDVELIDESGVTLITLTLTPDKLRTDF